MKETKENLIEKKNRLEKQIAAAKAAKADAERLLAQAESNIADCTQLISDIDETLRAIEEKEEIERQAQEQQAKLAEESSVIDLPEEEQVTETQETEEQKKEEVVDPLKDTFEVTTELYHTLTEEPQEGSTFRYPIYPQARNAKGNVFHTLEDITDMLPTLESIKNNDKADPEIVSYCENLITKIEEYQKEQEEAKNTGHIPPTSTEGELRNLIGRGLVLCNNKAIQVLTQKEGEERYPQMQLDETLGMTDEQRQSKANNELVQKFWIENANRFTVVNGNLPLVMSRLSLIYSKEEKAKLEQKEQQELSQMLGEPTQENAQQQVITGQVK